MFKPDLGLAAAIIAAKYQKQLPWGGVGFVQFPSPALRTTRNPLRTFHCCVLNDPILVDCCFEAATSIGGGRVGGISCSKMMFTGVELPFPRSLGGGDRSRLIEYTPDAGRRGSGRSVGGGLHDEAI